MLRPGLGADPASTHGQVERRNVRALTLGDMGGKTTMVLWRSIATILILKRND